MADGTPGGGAGELDALRQERDEYLAGWQRAKADFINYRRGEVQRLTEVAEYATLPLVADLLRVLDSFDRALPAKGGHGEGLQKIRSQLDGALKQHGLARVQVSPGDPFSPETMESLGEAEADRPEGTVAEVIEEGYLLRGKLVRPARVRISKGKVEGK